MKRIKKTLKGKGKIVAALAVVISFAAVLVWHQMQNASAHNQESPGFSRTYTNGYGRFYVDGPGNKSSWLEVKFYCSGLGKNVTQGTFNNKGRNVTFSENQGGGGDYDLHLASWSATTYKNNNGRYTSLDVKIRYTIPAHEYESWQSQDSSNDYYVKSTEGSTGHEKSEHTVYQILRISAYSIGLSTHTDNNVRDFNCSRTFHMAKSQYSVYYNGNGGTGADVSWNFTDGDNFAFPTVSRRGYTFDKWIDQGTGWESSTDWIVCGGNYTEIAQWIANQYNVSFDDNGADSGNVSDSTATYDSNFTLPESGYKKKGYKFLGWSTNENATSPQYTAGQSFTYQTDGDTVFYAVWAKSDFEVKFHGNGSSAADYTANLTYNKSVSLPKNIFERPGYTFIGWAQKEDGDKEVPEEVKYTDGQAVKDLCEPGETCHLYAIWKKSDGSFETKNIIHDDKMFLGDVNLTGQNGTGYSNANIDSKSAHIDKEDDPGYFTDRYGSNNN